MVTICNTSLKLNNSKFCPYSEFMRLRRPQKEQLLYPINHKLLDFITDISLLKLRWLQYVPPCVTFTNSTFWTQKCIYLFCTCLQNKQRIFPIQRKLFRFYNRYLTLYSRVVTICTASLTLHNSRFCPQSEFVFFLWIPEKIVFNSLHSIDWFL